MESRLDDGYRHKTTSGRPQAGPGSRLRGGASSHNPHTDPPGPAAGQCAEQQRLTLCFVHPTQVLCIALLRPASRRRLPARGDGSVGCRWDVGGMSVGYPWDVGGISVGHLPAMHSRADMLERKSGPIQRGTHDGDIQRDPSGRSSHSAQSADPQATSERCLSGDAAEPSAPSNRPCAAKCRTIEGTPHHERHPPGIGVGQARAQATANPALPKRASRLA